ncbi:hypothetical protein M409DRAFT_58782 [Zasmidium cellare ATCC 36951]|uniref:Uncharacterized protein n=1 Tax=Zasmidium cellare ATCC 36951 TaxID=1080233 RepID=A0A6A6C8E2_ZASCE|nr:uncharacterized protein M409DRAFT_58782 [Zasmidium cellare ATCC 36951]KAF2161696.1 hypothetical protein M409DRAFT_58782 [Zasmidium cellare ATCC 36951]
MSGPPNSHVSVFHFTSRISNAKIRKYKLATERGMGPASDFKSAMAHERSDAEQRAKPSPTPPTPATESPPVLPPPTKKPRLKLNVREQESNKNVGDTIRVSTRTKRKTSTFQYPGEVEMVMDEPQPAPKKTKKKQSPAPSSGLSSLESAPPSEREESPFIDPPAAPNSNDYGGDFMSFYVAGGDEDDAVEAERKSKAKPKGKSRAKTTSKPESETPKQKEPAPIHPPAKPVEKPSQPQQTAPPQPAQRQPAPAVQPPFQPAQQRQPPAQQQQQRPGPPQVPFPIPPPMHRGPPLPPQPPRLPQPIINFIDVVYDPKPTKPDTVAEMVQKLQELSSALTNFGGVPAIPPTPPQEKARPVPRGPPKPVFKPSPPEKPAPEEAPEADFLLSHFKDDDESESDDGNPVDMWQRALAHIDGPLSYGVEFIQNALKSWAQQRMTHQVTQQWQAQQQHQLHQQQLQAQRRGPGRPRRYDEPNLLHGPPPIIHMDLAQTPEGVAIKKFQTILASGCLQVNAILPIELSRALRHLYMQIDHLINQGSKSNDNWQPMSYQAQITAHKMRVDKQKEDNKKASEEAARQQQIANQQMMARLGIPGHEISSLTGEQDHAMELERRRSKQHAQAQPYNSQQHLNPLQLGPRPSGTPAANGPSPPPSRDGANPSQSTPATNTTPAPGPASASAGSPPLSNAAGADIDGDPNDPDSKAGQVHLDKMKLYMPGFLPRSGQSMKFSFAPHSDAALRVFGSESFPTDEPGSSLPNRGPMSAPPSSTTGPSAEASTAPNEQGLKALGGDAASPIQIDSDTPAEQAFGADGAQDKSKVEPSKKTPVVGTGGFNAINVPAPRPSSVPAESPDTIVVALRHPSGAMSASASPSISKTNGVPRVTNFPV